MSEKLCLHKNQSGFLLSWRVVRPEWVPMGVVCGKARRGLEVNGYLC